MSCRPGFGTSRSRRHRRRQQASPPATCGAGPPPGRRVVSGADAGCTGWISSHATPSNSTDRTHPSNGPVARSDSATGPGLCHVAMMFEGFATHAVRCEDATIPTPPVESSRCKTCPSTPAKRGLRARRPLPAARRAGHARFQATSPACSRSKVNAWEAFYGEVWQCMTIRPQRPRSVVPPPSGS